MPNDAKLPQWNDRTLEEKVDKLRELVDDLYVYMLGSNLENIVTMLERHHPADEIEAAHVQTAKNLIWRTPLIMSRSCESAHLTASALIIDLHTGKILLRFHEYLGKWMQVGGHSWCEADFAKVAMREAVQEAGFLDLSFFPDEHPPRLIDVDVHTIPERNQVPEHTHVDLRYLLATREPNRVFEALKHGLLAKPQPFEWLTCEKALREPRVTENIKRLIRKADQEYKAYLAHRQ